MAEEKKFYSAGDLQEEIHKKPTDPDQIKINEKVNKSILEFNSLEFKAVPLFDKMGNRIGYSLGEKVFLSGKDLSTIHD